MKSHRNSKKQNTNAKETMKMKYMKQGVATIYYKIRLNTYTLNEIRKNNARQGQWMLIRSNFDQCQGINSFFNFFVS